MRRRRLMKKYKPVILLALLVLLPLLIVRGCIAAFSPADDSGDEEEARLTPLAPSVTVSVYDAATGESRVMDLEEYLVGVVAAEMPSSFHPEALKAQAVAARTYALYRIKRSGCRSGCDVCTDSSCCQAYADPASLDGDKLQKITAAVNATRNQVILYEGQLIDALFHSTAGGMTEDSENVFAAAVPYLRSVASDETSAPRYEGAKTFSREEFAALLEDELGVSLSPDDLESQVTVVSRYDSGRVDTVTAGGRSLSGRDMRRIFSLDSTNFTLEFTGQQVILHTKGFGHGVGMSQTGADQMAQNGADYVEILTYYYTGVEVAGYDPGE